MLSGLDKTLATGWVGSQLMNGDKIVMLTRTRKELRHVCRVLTRVRVRVCVCAGFAYTVEPPIRDPPR
jgi:hypothetical protein